jgi:glycosyltransferase involved in cell wall biosynthesis
MSELKPVNKKKKILYLLFNAVPSSIVRGTIFNNAFKANGYEVRYYKLYSSFIEILNAWVTKKNYLPLFVLFFKLIQKCIIWIKISLNFPMVHKYDAIIIVKYTSSGNLRIIKRKGKDTPVLYDFDDAIWLPTFMGSDEFSSILKQSDFISCDNSYLAEKARIYNSNVFVLNGPVNPPVNVLDTSKVSSNENGLVEIGWVGSPQTLFYLYSINNVLAELHKKYQNIQLTLLGCGNNNELIPIFDDLKVIKIPYYSNIDMYEKLRSFDIGLYPLFDNELSLGRGSLKAIVYMSGAIPVVTSRLGENINLIQDGINGFLASTSEEWYYKLSQLIENKDLRKSIGLNGYHSIINDYSVNACFAQLEKNFLNHL